MESASTGASPLIKSQFSSPSAGVLLRRRILAWSQETGLPPSVCIRVEGRSFELHKFPLASKCGYLKKVFLKSSDVELPLAFPGGSQTFEMVALFSYDFPLSLDPFTVVALRCAAEFLEMTEDYATSNLSQRSDLYINQVVLQNWDDTLIVLQKCQMLLSMSEELLLVSRCIESLAFMACMEILDPEQRREQPVIGLQALAGRAWNSEIVKEIAGQNLWVKDLIALRFEFFKRIIGSLRRQGMKEKYVSPIILFYANKWVLSKKTHKFWENIAEQNGVADANSKVSIILQGILELLPTGEKASPVVPVAFYFALLSRSLTLKLSEESRAKLHDQVASLLHFARVEDFLIPESGVQSITSSPELETMEKIISIHLTKSETSYTAGTPLHSSSAVAESWDHYLSQIAVDPNLGPHKFEELIKVIPATSRQTHDHLYEAMNTFLVERPHLSNEEKASVCKYLNCQKLSQETCIQAVQNEFMPLRLIVQALFVQQLHTHQAFKNCSESFRYIQCGDFSGTIPSSRFQFIKSENIGETPYKQVTGVEENISAPLSSVLHNDLSVQSTGLSEEEYESTSFQLQALEQEIFSLKQNLQRKNSSKESSQKNPRIPSFRLLSLEGRATVRKRNPVGQARSCIGSVSWASQRKYANKILKVFRRIVMFGKGKSKMKKASSGLPNGSLSCKSKTTTYNGVN